MCQNVPYSDLAINIVMLKADLATDKRYIKESEIRDTAEEERESQMDPRSDLAE